MECLCIGDIWDQVIRMNNLYKYQTDHRCRIIQQQPLVSLFLISSSHSSTF